jgi:hypothetical protein
VDADLDSLATALYVRVDDLLKSHPERVPWRPRIGIAPKISDAELVTLAVMQALLGYVSEARWLRFATKHLADLFPYLPQQPGYNKRLRRLSVTMSWLIRSLGRDTRLWGDDVWVVDSTPVECAVAGDREALGAGGLGRVRLLRQPNPLLLGAAPAPAVHPARVAGWLRLDRGQSRRTPRPARHPHRPRGVRTAAPTDHRVHQRHLQRPTRPRTPRRTHPGRRRRPDRTTNPGPQGRDQPPTPFRRNT